MMDVVIRLGVRTEMHWTIIFNVYP